MKLPNAMALAYIDIDIDIHIHIQSYYPHIYPVLPSKKYQNNARESIYQSPSESSKYQFNVNSISINVNQYETISNQYQFNLNQYQSI